MGSMRHKNTQSCIDTPREKNIRSCIDAPREILFSGSILRERYYFSGSILRERYIFFRDIDMESKLYYFVGLMPGKQYIMECVVFLVRGKNVNDSIETISRNYGIWKIFWQGTIPFKGQRITWFEWYLKIVCSNAWNFFNAIIIKQREK